MSHRDIAVQKQWYPSSVKHSFNLCHHRKEYVPPHSDKQCWTETALHGIDHAPSSAKHRFSTCHQEKQCMPHTASITGHHTHILYRINHAHGSVKHTGNDLSLCSWDSVCYIVCHMLTSWGVWRNWKIRTLKSSHICLGIQKAVSYPGLGTCSEKFRKDPKSSLLTNFQGLAKWFLFVFVGYRYSIKEMNVTSLADNSANGKETSLTTRDNKIQSTKNNLEKSLNKQLQPETNRTNKCWGWGNLISRVTYYNRCGFPSPPKSQWWSRSSALGSAPPSPLRLWLPLWVGKAVRHAWRDKPGRP